MLRTIAVAGDQPHVKLRIGKFDARSEARGPAVNGVEPIGVHVVRKPAGAADPRDEHSVFTLDAQLG